MSPSDLKGMVQELRPALIRYLRARGQSPEDAEDLLQDLYIKLDGFDGAHIAEPRAYLYRMTHNLFLDRRRAAARRIKREEEWSAGSRGAQSDIDDRPSAEEALIAREQLATVSKALETLPQRTQEIFRRFRIDGQTQKAIAADLGLSKSAVEKHIYRAYRVLAETKAVLDRDAEDTTSKSRKRHTIMSRDDDN